MLTLGWSDGSTFLPVNSILLSTENKKNRINEAAEVDKRTVGYRRRKLSMEKGTHSMLALLKTAKKAAIPAKCVLFDSCFLAIEKEEETVETATDDEKLSVWQKFIKLFK